MLAILLALGSAVAYGATDFFAGWLSRRSDYARVGLLAQLAAAAGSILVSAAVGGHPSGASLWWGALSGLGGGLGTLALYRGLGRGKMNVVAPLSGVLAAGLPALFGFALGERPAPGAMVGLVLALPAVWLTARPEETGGLAAGPSTGIADGVLAGLGFAVLFIGLQRGGRDGGLWPSAMSSVVSIVPMLGLYALRSARDRSVTAATDAWARHGPFLGGLLVAVAVTCYFLATQRGMLSVVAVLTSLYPAVTVALARWLLHERIGRWQGVGLGLAGLSVALIASS